MNKTNIEWVKNPDGTQGYTLNSKTGCLYHTPDGLCKGGGFPCYAFRLANGRLRSRYLANQNFPFSDNMYNGGILPAREVEKVFADPFHPRFWMKRLERADKFLNSYKKSVGIFLDDMSDWMGIGIPESWTEQELEFIKRHPRHRIYTLTKQPQNLIKWSPFPDNCWVGVTATDKHSYSRAIHGLEKLDHTDATVRFISCEPLLGQLGMSQYDFISGINWVIIGSQTKPYRPPRIEWVQEIVRACDKAGIPVFLKDNLKPLFRSGEPSYWAIDNSGFLRQEMPKEDGEKWIKRGLTGDNY